MTKQLRYLLCVVVSVRWRRGGTQPQSSLTCYRTKKMPTSPSWTRSSRTVRINTSTRRLGKEWIYTYLILSYLYCVIFIITIVNIYNMLLRHYMCCPSLSFSLFLFFSFLLPLSLFLSLFSLTLFLSYLILSSSYLYCVIFIITIVNIHNMLLRH